MGLNKEIIETGMPIRFSPVKNINKPVDEINSYRFFYSIALGSNNRPYVKRNLDQITFNKIYNKIAQHLGMKVVTPPTSVGKARAKAALVGGIDLQEGVIRQ